MLDAERQRIWIDEDDDVQAIVLLRKGEKSLPALDDVEAKIEELNERRADCCPACKIEPYYDRTDLIDVTTETVRENLLVGMVLVTMILLMFLSNVRTALIVAINIPLALLFAFAVLYVRGKSANLLSIGAVDFGIIVDSSVIMVENIYRRLTSRRRRRAAARAAHSAGRAARSRRACSSRPLIMVCALLPLFTMRARKGRSSARWPTPMPSPWAGRCCWR